MGRFARIYILIPLTLFWVLAFSCAGGSGPEPYIYPHNDSIMIAVNPARTDIIGGERIAVHFSYSGIFDSSSTFCYEVSSDSNTAMRGTLSGNLFHDIFSPTQRVHLDTDTVTSALPVTVRAYRVSGDGQRSLNTEQTFTLHPLGVEIIPSANSIDEGDSVTINFRRNPDALPTPLSFAVSGASVQGTSGGALFANGDTTSVTIRSLRDANRTDDVLTVNIVRAGTTSVLASETITVRDIDTDDNNNDSDVTIVVNPTGTYTNLIGGERVEIRFSYSGTFDSSSTFHYEVSSDGNMALRETLSGNLFHNIFKPTQHVHVDTNTVTSAVPVTVQAYRLSVDGQRSMQTKTTFTLHPLGVEITPSANAIDEGDSITINFRRIPTAIPTPLSFAVSGASVQGTPGGALFATGNTTSVTINSLRDANRTDDVLTVNIVRAGTTSVLASETITVRDIDIPLAPIKHECDNSGASTCRMQRKIDAATNLPVYFAPTARQQIETANDEDWFRVEMAAGAVYTLSASTSTSALEIDVTFESAVPIGFAPPIHNKRVSHTTSTQSFITPQVQHQYWLKVKGVGEGVGAYTIDIKQVDACAHNRTEIASYYWDIRGTPNPYDYRTDAICILTVGTERDGEIVGGIRDSDAYLVLLKPNTRYRFRVVWNTPPNREFYFLLGYVPEKDSIADGGRQIVGLVRMQQVASAEKKQYDFTYRTGNYSTQDTAFIISLQTRSVVAADQPYRIIVEEISDS